MQKECSRCQQKRDLKDFAKQAAGKFGRCSICKDCRNIEGKTYREHNSTAIKQAQQQYYQENKAEIKKRQRQYACNNRVARKQYQAQWREQNRSKYNEYQRNWKAKQYRNNIEFRLATLLRERLYSAIVGKSKAGSAIQDLGCDLSALMSHLEVQFTKGMTWDNYGQWHIDHIKPLCSFDLTDRIQFLQACHYKNLQPLWAQDNKIKGGS